GCRRGCTASQFCPACVQFAQANEGKRYNSGGGNETMPSVAKPAKQHDRMKQHAAEAVRSIDRLTVCGFKSISEERSIEIRPLTILAGANSSGKSSMLHAILLLKQTLEATYDAGPLRLDGPNVKFSTADQLLSRISRGHSLDTFHVGMRLNTGESFRTRFRKEYKTAFRIEGMDISWGLGELAFWPEMTEGEIVKTGITKGMDFAEE